MAPLRDFLCGMLAAVGKGKAIGHAATLISPENGTMMRSRWGGKRLIFPLGTPILLRFLSIADSPFHSSRSVEFVS